MHWLETDIAGSEAWRWLAASGLMLLTVLATRLFLTLVHRRMRALADRSRMRVDDVVIGVLEQTKWFFYLGLGVYLGSRMLDLGARAERVIVLGATIVLLVQIGVWANHAIRLSVGAWHTTHERQPGQTTIAAGIAFIAQLTVWTIVILMGLGNMGVEITALIAGLGMGGIAAALAVQSILGDIFAALSIYFDRPFAIGDFIEVGEDKGHVERIGLRSTRIRGLGGEQLVYSNRALTSNRVRNFRRLKERRVAETIALDTDEATADQVERAVEILREIIEEVGVRFERAHFAKLGSNALELELVYWVEDNKFLVSVDRQHTVNLAILRRFEEEGIPLASSKSKLELQQRAPRTGSERSVPH